jgi:serine/threonine-protein kinase RsbT
MIGSSASARNPDAPERRRFRILAEIDVAEARSEARRMAERHGFRASAAYRFATAVSELGSNLVFHARDGGEIELLASSSTAGALLECIASDDGPGIPDVAMAMNDGYSTSGSLGCGLPGTQRLVDQFEISAQVGVGTRVRCGSHRR